MLVFFFFFIEFSSFFIHLPTFKKMNLAPETTSIEAQRDTELLLLDYLRSTNPHIYALWCKHPDCSKAGEDDDNDNNSDSSASATTATSQPASTSASRPQEQPRPSEVDTAEECFEYQEAQFHRVAHVTYASTHLQDLPAFLEGMYSSRPWIAYLCLQSADLLGVVESDLLARTPAADIAAFLHSCLSHDKTCEAELRAAARSSQRCTCAEEKDAEKNGFASSSADAAEVAEATERPAIGFAGGPVHQWPHLASSYAACCALAVLAAHGNDATLRSLPRAAIKRWLLTLRNDDGSFCMHGGGEADIRASYCAAVLTSLLCLDDPTTFDPVQRGAAADMPREYADDVQYEPVLTLQTAKFVAACQTHEGGFTCSSMASEAHGAYTQCGLAALLLMKQPHLIHQSPLRRWLAARQLNCEGGFNGRTNKLVDSCYSHWVGASHVLLRTVEAYVKCFSPLYGERDGGIAERDDSEEEGNESEAGPDAAPAYLLAREVVLLDHAQLLDAQGIQVTDTAAWDRAEAQHFQRVDLVDQFLSADDACRREATAKQAAISAQYDSIVKACDALNAEKTSEPHESHDDRLHAFHEHQAFLYADVGDYYFNQRKLQDYVLRCCQDADIGGLMDKPGTAHDTYHTCYSLSGVSTAQNLQYLTHAAAAQETSTDDYLSRAFAQSYLPKGSTTGSFGVVLSIPGPSPAAEMSVLRTTSPIFNIHKSSVLAALRVWGLKSFL